MPNPSDFNGDKQKFISACIADNIKEGKTRKESAGKCYGIWSEHIKKEKSISKVEKAIQTVESLIRKEENRLAELKLNNNIEKDKKIGLLNAIQKSMVKIIELKKKMINKNKDNIILKTTSLNDGDDMGNGKEWIGVDLDGTLAEYTDWKGIDNIGKPIQLMVDRVKEWLKDGISVKIFTARVANNPEAIPYIETWCKDNIGQVLPITNEKDLDMIELWDDRSIHIETNTGKIIKKM